MTTMISTTDPELRTAASRLYDAECALHAAHQTHEDCWIAAANERLHAAVEQYLAAEHAHVAGRPGRAA